MQLTKNLKGLINQIICAWELQLYLRYIETHLSLSVSLSFTMGSYLSMVVKMFQVE